MAVNAREARAKVEHEYHRYRHQLATQPHPIDTAFEQAATQLKKLPRPRKTGKKKE